jgi:hypothetical protein
MSTHSFIAQKNSDGTITGVYCHFDGYPDGVGRVLTERYSTTALASALLQHGSISSVGDNVDETIFYHRDRGEDLEAPTTYDSITHMLHNVAADFGVEYAYVWNGTTWQDYPA